MVFSNHTDFCKGRGGEGSVWERLINCGPWKHSHTSAHFTNGHTVWKTETFFLWSEQHNSAARKKWEVTPLKVKEAWAAVTRWGSRTVGCIKTEEQGRKSRKDSSRVHVTFSWGSPETFRWDFERVEFLRSAHWDKIHQEYYLFAIKLTQYYL